MAEIKKILDLNEVNLPDGQSTIEAVSTSTGLADSPRSNAVTFNSSFLTYGTDPVTGQAVVTGILDGFTIASIPRVRPEDRLPVIGIAADAFSGNEDLETVIIPNSITFIGDRAFDGCVNLTSVTFTDQKIVVYFRNGIGWNEPAVVAIYSNVSSVLSPIKVGTDDEGCDVYRFDVPIGVTRLSFYDASTSYPNLNAEDVVLLEGSKIINYGCYDAYTYNGRSYIRDWDCEPNFDDIEEFKLKPVTIGKRAFHGCESLTSINIPNSVTVIGEDAFSGANLEDGSTFSECSALRTIGDFAFAYSLIKDIVLPHSLITLGYGAFTNCYDIQTVYIGENVREISGSAFEMDEYGGPTTVLLPSTSKLEKIGSRAFYKCNNLENIGIANGSGYLLPDTVWYIGKNAFYSCTHLEVVGLLDKYGWLVTKGNVADDRTSDSASTALLSSALSEKEYVALALTSSYLDYNWYKIEVMVSPTLDLDGYMLTITDPIGIAETFKIYLVGAENDTHIATVDASTGALTVITQE